MNFRVEIQNWRIFFFSISNWNFLFFFFLANNNNNDQFFYGYDLLYNTAQLMRWPPTPSIQLNVVKCEKKNQRRNFVSPWWTKWLTHYKLYGRYGTQQQKSQTGTSIKKTTSIYILSCCGAPPKVSAVAGPSRAQSTRDTHKNKK
jgi:hypothetical protein